MTESVKEEVAQLQVLAVRCKLLGFTAAYFWCTEYGATIKTPRGYIYWQSNSQRYMLRLSTFPPAFFYAAPGDEPAIAALIVNAGLAELPE